MYNTIINKETGKIIISYTYDPLSPIGSEDQAPVFNNPGDEFILSIKNLENIIKFTKFTYDSLGLKDNRFLLQEYRISRNDYSWSNWFDLNNNILNFPIVDPLDKLYIDIKWIRVGSSDIGDIKLLEWKLEGDIQRDSDVLSDRAINILPDQSKVIQSPFIYKVFKINDIEIISSTGIQGLDIRWRYSQDSSRTWSDWEPFTRENVSSVRINPIRFFQIEYYIENNTDKIIKINDINLIGDFQNVTKDYEKTNLFGIRECCQSNLFGTFDKDGNFIANTNLNSTGGENCDTNLFSPMTDENKANLYNPYAQNTAIKLLEKLSNDAQQVFGHKVTYFSTDADKKGQDHTLNEYQLYNVVCSGDIKVSIEGNNFPDSQIKMNIFDLDLFDSMEAHITKQQFKEIFGKQRRPAKEDFLYFCDLNRMYQVDHAQQFRSFNNSAVYYKLILKKYTQKANVQAGTIEIKNQIDKLTKNSTIDELMGIEQTQDKASIANKQQFTPLTRDPIRLEYRAQIDKELIENSSTIISKSNYDLSSVKYQEPAVIYNNLDPILRVSDNIGYQIWFNINNYLPEEVYNLFNNYDNDSNKGWRADLQNDKIVIKLNTDEYQFDLLGYQSNTEALDEETWYCYVLNINQRQRKMDQFIYKRNIDDENDDASKLTNTLLRKLYHNTQDITPIEYLMDSNKLKPNILASDMKATNIRLFIDVIPENIHNKILNQYIIGDDSKYLVFADNATTRLYLNRFPLNE
jgi:hypothetical protein